MKEQKEIKERKNKTLFLYIVRLKSSLTQKVEVLDVLILLEQGLESYVLVLTKTI